MAIITLITDFGTSDGYVGAMKGVIVRLAGSIPAPVIPVIPAILDLAHDLPPGDGARAMARPDHMVPRPVVTSCLRRSDPSSV